MLVSWEERTVGEVGRVAVGGEIVRKDLTDSEMGQHEVLTSFEWSVGGQWRMSGRWKGEWSVPLRSGARGRRRRGRRGAPWSCRSRRRGG